MKELVVFGAGNLGRRVAAAINPIAFCDNNPALWNTCIMDVPVLPPAEASALYSTAQFVVCIWHPSHTEGMADFAAQLRSLGVRDVVSFAALVPECGHMFWAPRNFYEQEASLIAAARALLDEEGRAEFDRQMRFRLGDLDALRRPHKHQYFAKDAVILSDDEYFVDCGAYDGDTLREFLTETSGKFRKYVALEPDPRNYRALVDASSDPRISVFPYGAGGKREKVSFCSAGESSRVTPDGDTKIELIALDELLAGERPTYIKMDIEGYELDALDGARKTIGESFPKLAICAYHRPEDLWRVPLACDEQLRPARITLRPHMHDGFDLVCYTARR